MKLPYFEVAAFTARPFAGNPAGVCVLEEWLPDASCNRSRRKTIWRKLPSSSRARLPRDPLVYPDRGNGFVRACHDWLGPRSLRHLGAQGASLVFHSPRLANLASPARGTPGARLPIAPRCSLRDEAGDRQRARPFPTALYQARDYFAVFEREADIVALRQTSRSSQPCRTKAWS